MVRFLLTLLTIFSLSLSPLLLGEMANVVYADGDGSDGGDGDGDDGGDDGGDDDGDDSGSDGGNDGGGDDGDGSSGSDDGGGDDFFSEEFVEWMSESQGGSGIAFYSAEENLERITPEVEQELIASHWNHSPRQMFATQPATQPSTQKVAVEITKYPFPHDTLNLTYARTVENSEDDIAVIIGNANYQQFGAKVPDVTPAYADAEAFTRYVREGLGVREGNIIHLKDATQAQMMRLFGTEKHPKGQLYDWVKPQQSRVTLYFSGHGAPGVKAKESNYLVPADADGARLALNGYPVEELYQNLSKLNARSVTVVLEACFSGVSQDSQVVTHASPIFAQRKPTTIPKEITVISAGGSDQIASWEQDRSNGLFTKYYLYAMSGKADHPPYGNGDGRVSRDELQRYLDKTLSYWARRYYGREQVAQIQEGKKL